VHPLVAQIQRRAERGDADAQVDLGALLEKGAGLPRDPARALQLYQRAGEQGNVFGQYFAGLLLAAVRRAWRRTPTQRRTLVRQGRSAALLRPRRATGKSGRAAVLHFSGRGLQFL
jgi:TPR repeat protein